MVQQAEVGGGIEALTFLQKATLKEKLFNLLVTAFCQLNLAGFLIDGEVTGRLSFLRHFALFEVGDQFIDGLIKL